ncbi:DUF4238 domain-containing protein, partial [Pseudodesulfovibrio sp.]|nr:DUF4238 domain-containing protein [Pseudodesulfovibrio sp.]
MASNKNQHFVPRCYLKQFSANENRKTVNLFNLDREIIVSEAPIKGQCSRSYFYGKEERLERAIQHIEDGYASMIEEITTFNTPVSPKNRVILFRFFLLQQMRTEAASRRSAQIWKETNEVLGKGKSLFTTKIKDAVMYAMKAYSEMMDYIDDLQIVLFKNRTAIPFVTSDDPAILINKWAHQSKRTRNSGIGLTAAGLICILPISPDVCWCAYDGGIYSIPNKKNWISIKKDADIISLNSLQHQNCFCNLYFGTISSDDIARLHEQCKSYRPTTRHRINYAIPEEESDNYTKYTVVDPEVAQRTGEALMHAESIPIVPSKWPSFFRSRSNKYAYSNETAAGFIRRAHQET